MTLMRWEPARELSSLQGEMNRLFNAFFDVPAAGKGATGWIPAMDLLEEDEHYVLRADLPGMDQGDVSIELEDNVLTIAGERQNQTQTTQEGYHRMERTSGAFRRTLTLPEGVEADEISASFDKGVLEVRVPKPEERKPRRVQIGVGSRAGTIEDTESQ
ncbi:MAG TPA: Hsp20/alpha crystallin family protein [Solirubrobacteraceae bacterium]|nr:Hsp20/alpha crystallin family protein [Solirubrobacteraceae bacterium]